MLLLRDVSVNHPVFVVQKNLSAYPPHPLSLICCICEFKLLQYLSISVDVNARIPATKVFIINIAV